MTKTNIDWFHSYLARAINIDFTIASQYLYMNINTVLVVSKCYCFEFTYMLQLSINRNEYNEELLFEIISLVTSHKHNKQQMCRSRDHSHIFLAVCTKLFWVDNTWDTGDFFNLFRASQQEVWTQRSCNFVPYLNSPVPVSSNASRS